MHFTNATEDTEVNYTARIDTVFVVCLIFVPKTVCTLPGRFSFKILLEGEKSTSLFKVLLLLTSITPFLRKKKKEKHCHK